MTQEDKELLLKDLCARLSYGVKGIISFDEDKNIFIIKGIFNILFLSDAECCHVEDFKPYLRPMSSMTEEEKKEYYETMDKYTHRLYPNSSDFSEHTEYSWTTDTFDFLNAHHLDYRGLIPMGLAIEVTKENNPY